MPSTDTLDWKSRNDGVSIGMFIVLFMKKLAFLRGRGDVVAFLTGDVRTD